MKQARTRTRAFAARDRSRGASAATTRGAAAASESPGPPGGHVPVSPALLLNSTYEPLRVVGWQRAVVLSLLGRVEVLEHHETQAVRTISHAVPAPAVIRLPTRAPDRARYVPFSRSNLYARDRSTCQYCGERRPHRELSYDHVLPRTRGGRTEWTNVVTCCLVCNRRKADRTPDEAGMPLRARPMRPTSILMTLSLTPERIPGSWQPYLAGFGLDRTGLLTRETRA